jgi:hypothetical protein
MIRRQFINIDEALHIFLFFILIYIIDETYSNEFINNILRHLLNLIVITNQK